MKFSDAQIDSMLQATGQQGIIDDNSLAGLTLWCKLLDPQLDVNEFSMSVELTDPSVKVRTSAISHLFDSAYGMRGRHFETDDVRYKIKRVDTRRSGLTILSLELI